MATIYEVTVRAGTYQKDGQEKVRYQRIGSVIETKKGPMLKLDQVPLVEGGWQGWAYLFEPKTDGKPVSHLKVMRQNNKTLHQNLMT